MPDIIDLIQRSFSAGEIAPSLWARADLSKYATGLRTCRNFVVHKHGGVSNRAGTYFIDETKYSTRVSVILPFRFSNDQTYVMEFGDLYIRFYKGGALLKVTDTDAPAWNITTDYVIGDLQTTAGVRYYCILAHINKPAPDATYWYPLTGDIYEIPTPYTEAQVADLRMAQSADVVSIVHPSHDPADLSRVGALRWILTTTSFAPGIVAPASPGATNGTAGTTVYRYRVSSVSEETGEESEPTAVFTCTGGAPTTAAPNVVTYTVVPGASIYNVYRELIPDNGVYGIIGIASGTMFNDINIIPSAGQQPVVNKTPFAGAGNKPSVVTYYQGRRVYAGTIAEPEKVVASKSDLFNNLSTSTPLRDDDAVTFSLAGDAVNRITGVVGLRKLIVLTEAGEWAVEGGVSGVLTPGNINPTPQSYNGAANIAPLKIGGELLYVQARGSVIRSLGFDLLADGYRGDDITLYASHLFKGHTVVSWAYVQIPDSTVWAVLDDGALLGLTYIKSQEVWGWHRHDTHGGLVESVTTIPGEEEDDIYLIVKRTINGAIRRYVEKFASRIVSDVVTGAFFVDCGLTYNGNNTDPVNTMTLTGGTTWSNTETLTLTSTLPTFVASNVGDAVVLEVEGVFQRVDITGYASVTEVSVRSVKDVAVAFRSVAIPDWSLAVGTLSGLDHLEGEKVSVLGDGSVIANTFDDSVPVVVTGGQITLDRPCSVVHVGLPIESDFETLDIDSPETKTALNKESLVSRVDFMVESSRGLWVGPDADHLTEYKQRGDEGYDELTGLATGLISVIVEGTHSKGGRVFVRQRDPLPLTILAAIPVGNLAGGGK